VGGVARTSVVLSSHNAGLCGTAGIAVVIGLAIFYGGVGQFMAGMWEVRNTNTFGATAFSTYGAFWLALGTYLLLITFGKIPTGDIAKSLGIYFVGFAIFNTYMLFCSARLNVTVFGVLLTLAVTEIFLLLGLFSSSYG